MDEQNFLIGIEAFRRGEARPLLVPGSVQSELTINICFEEGRREWEAENGRNVGYQFPWGQIHEDRRDTDTGGGSDELAMEWHFALSEIHTEFLWAGGNLGELSDWCVVMLEDAAEQAREERSQEVLPPYVAFSEGNLLSAFSIEVWGSKNVPAARAWVADVFIPIVLPLVMESARQINVEATPTDSD
jgi:hypothetical protein